MSDLMKFIESKKIDYTVSNDGSVSVGGDLDLRGTGITSLPDNLSVGGYLDLEDTSITSLPDNLSVGGYLDLRGTGITSLPDNLSVGGSLDLNGTSITSLPDNLSVGGCLDLSGTGITSLPDNLSVGGYLDLSGTGITSLPDLFSCRHLYLDPKSIGNIAYRENCGYSSRTIFSAWVNDDFRIAAGCFWGTLSEFESAVDDKYSGNAAETYKQAARDCIAELTEKLNQGE
ncbi:leucine-rich repeat domain-containing protein [Lonsdalea quercina]|uniref:leucine-rich repeat domain-containing protein n=1 Tax=Lonsdalea quercina TaxID=71657 RepID=UPI0039765CD0